MPGRLVGWLLACSCLFLSGIGYVGGCLVVPGKRESLGVGLHVAGCSMREGWCVVARRQLVVVTDDLDGSEGADTFRFGVGGVEYEIDLIESHRLELEAVLRPYVEAGRRLNRDGRPVGVPQGGGPTSSKLLAAKRLNRQVREWAAANGVDIGGKGRIPNTVLAAFQANDAGLLRGEGPSVTWNGKTHAVVPSKRAEPAPEAVFSEPEPEPEAANGYKPGATVKAAKAKPEGATVVELPTRPTDGQVRRWMREHWQALGLATLPSANGRVAAAMVKRYMECDGGAPVAAGSKVAVRKASGRVAGRKPATVKAGK